MLYNKVKFVCNLQACRANVLLRLRLEKVKLAKQLFVLDIEQGQEVFIPMELSQDKFPINFKYYDFIINLLHNQLSQETKDLNAFKNVFRINFYQNENFVQKIGEKLGIFGDKKKETELGDWSKDGRLCAFNGNYWIFEPISPKILQNLISDEF